MIAVTERKYWSQYINDDDYLTLPSDTTPNLVGSVMERIRSQITFLLSVRSENGYANGDTGGVTISGGNTLTRVSGSYVDDHFREGMEFSFVATGCTFTGTITAISLAEDEITFTVSTGSAVNGSYTDDVMHMTSDLLAAEYHNGLIENSEATNFLNKVDGSDMMYQLNGISTAFQDMNVAAGAVSWYTGRAQIKQVAAVSGGECSYVIIQDFIIPYYIQAWRSHILAHTLPPDLWAGSKTLKHVWNIKFRQALSNPNTEIDFTDDVTLGSVGFFGENYNGLGNNYTFALTGYVDTVTGASVDDIQINRKTTVRFTINSSGLFSSSTVLMFYGSGVLDPAQYAPGTTEFEELWTYFNMRVVAGTNNTGTGVVKRFDSVIANSSLITCEVDIELSTAQQALFFEDSSKTILIPEMLIAGQVSNPALSQANSDKVVHCIDISTLLRNTDVADLFEVTRFELLKHDIVSDNGPGYTSFQGFVGENIMMLAKFNLNLSNNAYLRRLRVQVYAKNQTTGDGFAVDDYELDLSSGRLIPTGSPGVYKQAFSLDTTRGYLHPTGDYMNRVRLAEFIDPSPFRWGSYDFAAAGLLHVLLQAHGVESGYLNNDYTVLLFDPFGAGFDYVNDVNLSSEFQVTALSAPTNAAIRYFAIKNDADPADTVGVAWGEETLIGPIAGVEQTTTITFDVSLGTTNYAVFMMDVSGNGFHTITKSNGSFTIKGIGEGVIRYVAIKYTGVTGVETKSQAITAGSNTINFNTSLGSTDFTWIYKTWENWSNNIVETGRTASSVTFTAEADGTIDSIAILNT